MRFLPIAALLLLPVFAHAQLYRWTDPAGNVHYTDQPPPSNARNVQKKTLAAKQGASVNLPYALQEAGRNFPVTLYVAEECKDPCDQARDLLNKRGVPYREINAGDAKGLEQLRKISGGNSVPVITVGNELNKGFEISAYNAALDNAGYPRSSLLPPGAKSRLPENAPVKAAPGPAAEEVKPAYVAPPPPESTAVK